MCGVRPRAGPRAFSCVSCGVELDLEPNGVFAAKGTAMLSFPDDGDELLAGVEEESFWFRHRNQVIALALERFPISGPLWDVGGGNGFQALVLERAGHRVVVVEPGAARSNVAALRGVGTVVRGTLGAIGLPPASIAGLSLFDVVEHLDDPAPLLAECRRVLAPGGRLFVTVPAWQALWSEADDYAQHHRRYTRAGLEQQLVEAGFRVDACTYFFQALVLPIAIFRALPYRLSLRRAGAHAEVATGEHAPGGLSQRVVERLLARELASLRAGARPLFGASIIAVAHVEPIR